MYQIPRAIGQKIADNLGVRLRHGFALIESLPLVTLAIAGLAAVH